MSDVVLVQYTVQDVAGAQESIPTFFADGTTLSQVQTEVTAMAPLLDAVTGSKLTKASVTFPLTLPGGIKTDPVATYLNSRGGLLGYDCLDTRYKWSTRIPALLEAFISGDDVPTPVSGDLFDYIHQFDATATIPYTNRYQDQVIAFIAASLSLHKGKRTR